VNLPSHAYVGVDQTGAVVKRRGETAWKPLPAALIVPGTGRKLRIIAADKDRKALAIDAFNAGAIASLAALGGTVPERIVTLVDCVLGLPSPMRRHSESIRDLFSLATAFNDQTTIPMGRKRAAAFFHQLLCESNFQGAPGERWPLRHCERLTASNSVFQEHPFQKNVQSGTYRIWCDLGSLCHSDCHPRLWPHDYHESSDGKIPGIGFPEMIIAEGYPSLYWKKLFDLRSRQPASLRPAVNRTMERYKLTVESADWELIESDPDLADAVVLGLAAFVLDSRGLFLKAVNATDLTSASVKPDMFEASYEGWIAGAHADFFTAS
jgi:hypothetical protein